MDILIYICAIFGLAFLLKESDGPWGLIGAARNKVLADKYIGVFFYKLLDCYFCLGFHCGWIVCLLSEKSWHPNLLFCWGLAGGIICLILDRVMTKLAQQPPEPVIPAPILKTRSKKI